ncbi:MAG: hypothetical protein WAV95_18160 [Azonexus sp.]
MPVRQLQVANDSVQDRLVLRIATDANEEIRVFLTRRFLREIWPHLSRVLLEQVDTPPAVGTCEAAGQPASFDQAFQADNPRYPLGSTPLLASEASFEKTAEDQLRVSFREGRERSFNLNLNSELLQALCAMLRAAAGQAQWDLALDYDTPAPLGKTSGKSRLH